MLLGKLGEKFISELKVDGNENACDQTSLLLFSVWWCPAAWWLSDVQLPTLSQTVLPYKSLFIVIIHEQRELKSPAMSFYLIFRSQCVLRCVKAPDGNVTEVRKIWFSPKGTFKQSLFLFFFFFHMSTWSRFTIVVPTELNQKQYTSKKYYQTKSVGFYERWLAVGIERLVLRGGPRRGGTSLTNVFPWHGAAALLRWKLHDEISEWHLHASFKISVISAVTHDMSPGRDPQSNLVLPCEWDPRLENPWGCLAFTVEILSMKVTPLKRLLSCPLKP